MSLMLKNKNFQIAWIAQFFYQLGSSFVEMTLLYHVGESTESGFAVAFLFFLLKFPVLFMGVISGLIVDRYDRRRIMVYTVIVRVVATGFLALLNQYLAVVYVMVLMMAVLNNLYRTAEGALIPEIVDKEDLMQASGMFNITEHGTTLLALGVVFGMNAWLREPLVTFGVGGILMATGFLYQRKLAAISIMVNNSERKKVDGSAVLRRAFWANGWTRVKKELQEGFNYIKTTLWCRRMVLHLIVVNTVILVIISMAKVYGQEYLATTSMGEVGQFVIMPILFGFVMAVAALPYLQRRHSKLTLIAYGATGAALSILGMGLFKLFSPWTSVDWWARWICYILLFAIGASAVNTLVPGYVLLQESAENRVRGRALGVLFSAITGLSAIPLLLVGAVMSKWGVVPILVVMGLLLAFYSSTLFRYITDENIQLENGADINMEP